MKTIEMLLGSNVINIKNRGYNTRNWEKNFHLV